MLDEMEFMKDPNNRYGKRVIRVSSSTSTKRVFLIGKLNTQICCCLMGPLETEVLRMATLIMQQQDDILDKYSGATQTKAKWRGDLVQVLFGPLDGSGYGIHNDKSVLL